MPAIRIADQQGPLFLGPDHRRRPIAGKRASANRPDPFGIDAALLLACVSERRI
jgi:hypothetical protein